MVYDFATIIIYTANSSSVFIEYEIKVTILLNKIQYIV